MTHFAVFTVADGSPPPRRPKFSSSGRCPAPPDDQSSGMAQGGKGQRLSRLRSETCARGPEAGSTARRESFALCTAILHNESPLRALPCGVCGLDGFRPICLLTLQVQRARETSRGSRPWKHRSDASSAFMEGSCSVFWAWLDW